MATIPAKKATGPAKKPTSAAKAPAAKATAPATKAAAKKPPAAKARAATKAPAAAKARTPAKAPAATKAAPSRGATPKKATGSTKTSSFDAAFLEAQRALLIEERANLVGQAQRLEDEAAELMEDLDPGDVQFDDESGEGDSLVVERERDLALSAQARQTVSDIDAALARIKDKTYGFSVVSGRPIPKERLRAIPWATELVEEKVGGLGSRR